MRPAGRSSPPHGNPAAELVEHARTLDAQHRLANRGKPISRDNVKLALGIATDKATALIRIVRDVHKAAPPSEAPGRPPDPDLSDPA